MLTVELPELGARSYYSGWVGKAVAKRAGRFYYVSHAARQSVELYQVSTRQAAIRRAQRAGSYERIAGLRVVEEVGRSRRVRWSEPDGRLRERHLNELTAAQRTRMFVRGEDGLSQCG
ncbi:hypothetical protein [Streptomyces sp. NPDC058249]|uniref:hypothetical protein n=1 Tax=Streptomyces sp. NPDC058249 TaxID=3346403 RepID=UPI0036EFA2B3